MSMSTMMYADMTASLVGCEHENDREPDPPHEHLGGGWLGGSLADLNYGRRAGSSVRLMIGAQPPFIFREGSEQRLTVLQGFHG